MSGINLERLLFDPADADNSPNLGAYLRSSDGTLITHTTDGAKEALDVNVIGTSDSGVFEEDSAHTSGDRGQFVLAVQTASQGALATDGDYAPFQVDSQGRLRVIADIDLIGDLVGDDQADTEDPLKVGSRTYDQASALSAVSAAGDKANLASDLYRRIFVNDAPNISMTAASVSVGLTEVALPASALAGRTRIMIQNKGDKSIYLGPTGVTTASGIEVSKGGTFTMELGQAIALFGISSAAAQDVRVVQFA